VRVAKGDTAGTGLQRDGRRRVEKGGEQEEGCHVPDASGRNHMNKILCFHHMYEHS
jgi:hypothetical protein